MYMYYVFQTFVTVLHLREGSCLRVISIYELSDRTCIQSFFFSNFSLNRGIRPALVHVVIFYHSQKQSIVTQRPYFTLLSKKIKEVMQESFDSFLLIDRSSIQIKSSQSHLDFSPPLFSSACARSLLLLQILLLLLLLHAIRFLPSRHASPNAIPRPQSTLGPSPGCALTLFGLRWRGWPGSTCTSSRTGPEVSVCAYAGIRPCAGSVVAVCW